MIASAVSASRPIAASHSTGPVVGRKPMRRATTRTMATASIVWMTLPMTWPIRTDARAMAIVRKRAMMPSGHVHRDRDRGPLGRPGDGDQEDPGNDVRDVFGAAAGHAAETGAERAAEDVDEQEQEHDRDRRR